MSVIDSINQWLSSLDTKVYYRYIAGFLAVTALLVCLLIYYYYSSINYYKRQIRIVNNQREEVQTLLEKAALIDQQKREVISIIDEDPGFKIVAYFADVLKELNLTDKSDRTITQEQPSEPYNVKILQARFNEVTMKEVVELLDKLDKNKRIYIKDLEIERSKKNNRRIDARLSIATFEKRSE
jgi:type II secretory pathway component PulM